MRKPDRSQVLTILFAIVVVVAVLVFFFRPGDVRPPPSSKGYYGGPMMNKARSGYGDDAGHVVPTPPGSTEPGKRPLPNLLP
jgi:hypothetical protein